MNCVYSPVLCAEEAEEAQLLVLVNVNDWFPLGLLSTFSSVEPSITERASISIKHFCAQSV